ncbi:MAG: ATP-binding cassette domain-containing protein, partial [Lachnospiraceae bacterium]|nr:ATP-binding cassette domain-containing protein [Lachnospiraceae bacterium]
MNDIVFKNVCKSYDGKVNVIENLNLTIPAGQRLILLGPSGCGKSTILRMIAGLESITSGDLYMGGVRVNDIEPGDRDVAMVFQNYALYPHMTVNKNIQFGMEIAKVPKAERDKQTDWALEILGLSEYKERLPRQLSGGQRQRVALCRALVKKAP